MWARPPHSVHLDNALAPLRGLPNRRPMAPNRSTDEAAGESIPSALACADQFLRAATATACAAKQTNAHLQWHLALGESLRRRHRSWSEQYIDPMFSSWTTPRTFGLHKSAWQRHQHWPSLCLVCHAWPSQPLCESCVAQFAQRRTRCTTCALPCERDYVPLRQHKPAPIERCLCAVDYGYPWADCVARFKFHADPGLRRALAHLMRHAPWVEPALEAADSLIRMPLSIQRLSERGYRPGTRAGTPFRSTQS
jgi:hypothetical protein